MLKRLKLFLILLTFFQNNFFFLKKQNHISYSINNSEILNNSKADKINSYKPAFFLGDDDLKDLNNGKQVKIAAINEIKEINTYEHSLFDVNKFFFSGFKVKSEKQIEVYFSYIDEEVFTILFNVYKTTRFKTKNAIAKKFQNKKYEDNNDGNQWSQKSYAESYSKEKISENTISETILVDNEKVIISKKRLLFQNWTRPVPKTKASKTTVYLNYLAKNNKITNPMIAFNVKLKYKKEKEKEEKEESENESVAEGIAIATGVGVGAAIGVAVTIAGEKLSESLAAVIPTITAAANDALSSISSSIASKAGEQTTKEAAKQVAKEATKEATKATVKEVAKKTLKEAAKDITKKLAEEFDKIWEGAKDILDSQLKGLEDLATETGKAAVKQSSKRIAQKVAEETGKNIIKQSGKKIAQKIAEETGKNFAEQAIKETGKEVFEQAAKQVTEKISEQVISESTKEVAKQTVKTAAEKVAEDLSKTVTEQAIGEAAKEAAMKRADDIFKELVQETIRQIRNNLNVVKPTAAYPYKRSLKYFNAVLADDNKNKWIDDINESIKEGTAESVNEAIHEAVYEHINENLEELIQAKLKPHLNNLKNDFIKKTDFSKNYKLTSDEINEVITNKIPDFLNKEVTNELNGDNFNNVAINQIKLKMLELIRVEIMNDNIKDEYILTNTSKNNLFSEYVEKTYYITYLQKYITIKKPNDNNKNLTEQMIANINNYLSNSLNSTSINKLAIQNWINNNKFEQNIKKFLDKIITNKINLNNLDYDFTFNDLLLKKYNFDESNLFLEFSSSILKPNSINLKINLL